LPPSLRALAAVVVLLLAGCATRPVNPPLEAVAPDRGYRFTSRQSLDRDASTLIVVAFSGGGTRAAAFSFGVLEALRDVPIPLPDGRSGRLLDEIDIVTGVSGGSFTALAFGLHGDALFDFYADAFLKRDVERSLVARIASPLSWPALASAGYGRSELAAELYDELVFHGATFGDLVGRRGPLVIASATDISTGSRLAFIQTDFDLICSDLSAVRLSRAAAASSAVPLILSPVTLDNYGGRCGFREPAWTAALREPRDGARASGRARQRLREIEEFQRSAERPYLHLVDGGVSDNLGLRTVLEALEQLELAKRLGRRTRLDHVRRIAFVVVNSVSQPRTDWDRRESPPNDVQILVKAAGVPIDRYSYEAIELLYDKMARWDEARRRARNGDVAPANALPDLDIVVVDVSFAAHADAAEREFLNDQPTSFALGGDAVDRLRTAARRILFSSEDFRRLVRDLGGRIPE
jgi:NTE family protein